MQITPASLHEAREEFAALLRRKQSQERHWQRLFTTYPFILSESLPLKLSPDQVVPRGRPGRSEADFVFYPENRPNLPVTYGIIELKRPGTSIVSTPRRDILRLSSDAQTALAQAVQYAETFGRELNPLSDGLVAVGGGVHIFLIVGLSEELKAKVTNDLLRRQLSGLLPPGVQLLPYDTLLGLFTRQVPPHLHVVVPTATTQARHIRSAFIAHASQDARFARLLTEGFVAAGVPYTIHEHDDARGEFDVAFDEMFRKHRQVVLVLSNASVHTEWFEWELRAIHHRQSSADRGVFCPVAIDPQWREYCPPSARHILRAYSVHDFLNWQSTISFQAEFNNLLWGLDHHP